MYHIKKTSSALQQPGQLQELILIPILTLVVLSFVVQSANSAVDPTMEKRKITEQLKRRLRELHKDEEEQSIATTMTSHLPGIHKREKDSGLTGRNQTPPVTVVWRAVGGRIAHGLYDAARIAGVPARIVDALADMDWDFDVSSDLQPGDIFKVIFEELQQGGKARGYGHLLAAEIITNRPFLRYPLRFTRISSRFTAARLHPILHRVRPHWGVDFAAPVGTPVRAVARGTVRHAGRKGGFGICLRIDHPGPYGSFYAHLQRLAKGVKTGTQVERGQVIGYVGMTGLATGPHLHFALLKGKQYIDPLTAKLSLLEAETRHYPSLASATKKRRLNKLLAALTVERQAVTLIRPVSGAFPQVWRQTATADGQPPRLLATSRSTQPNPH